MVNGHSPSALDALAGSHPWLLEAIRAHTCSVVPERLVDRLAGYLELTRAREILRQLKAGGTRGLAFAGYSPLFDEMARTGLLDDFQAIRLFDRERGERFAFGWGYLPVQPFGSYSPKRDEAVLALEPGLQDLLASASPVREVPRLTDDRQVRCFSDRTRREFPWVFIEEERRALEAIDRVFSPGKTVLFAGVYAYFNFGRLSRALGRLGYSTLFLCLNPSNLRFKDNQFDAVLDASGDMELFYRLLSARDYAWVHFQAWLGLHHFAAGAAALSRSPFLAEFNDLPRYVLEPEDFNALFGPGMYELETRSTRVIIEHAQASLFNLVEGGEADILTDIRAKRPSASFHSYPIRDLFPASCAPEYAPPYRIAFAGSLNPSSHPDNVFGDVKLFGLAQELVAQGLNFHIFLNPYQNADPRGPFWDYFHLAACNPLFSIHAGVPPADLSERLAGMHYGSMLYRFPPGFAILDEHMERMMPSKFFTYLEAGLPVLVSSELNGVAREVERHGLGLVVGQDDLAGLGDLLARADYRKLRGNVLAYREANEMDRQVERLMSLIAPVGPGG